MTNLKNLKKTLVAQITHDLNVGGLQRVVVDICENIDKNLFDIVVICLRAKGPFAVDLENKGIKVVELLHEKEKKTDYLSFWKLGKILSDIRPDIIHTHNTQPFIDGTIAAKLASVPVIIHTDHARDFPDKRRYMFAEWFMSHFVSKIVAVSDHTKQNLVNFEKIDPDSIVTILNGVNRNRFDIPVDVEALKQEIDIPREYFVAGTGVRLSEQKGITYLIKAAPLVIKELPEIRFVVAGDGPLRKQLEDEAHALNVSTHFKFLGQRLDMNKLLHVFDIYVLPSLWEGHPLVLLEAMAARKPVIATNVGGVSTAVTDGENGLLVSPRNPEQLAHAILKIARNLPFMRTLGQRGYEIFLEEFSVSVMVRRYEELYMQCLQKTSHKKW